MPSIPSPSMDALLFDQPGDAQTVLRFGTAPVPEPAAGEVRIRVLARVIQPADRLFIAGRYRVQPRCPQVAGFDGAGIVDALGTGADPGLLGRRVAFRAVGAWAAYAVAPLERVHEVPDGIGMEQACQFPLNPLTAWGLLDVARIPARGALLATAGNSAVGRWIAALARERGLAATLVAREGDGFTACNAYRPAGVVRSGSMAELLRQIRPASGFDAVIDPVGGPGTLELMDACAPGGTLVSYGVLDDRPFQLTASRMLYRNLRWEGFGIDLYLARLGAGERADAAATVWRLMCEQPGLTTVAARHGLRDHAKALQDSTRLARQGKVLLVEEPQ